MTVEEIREKGLGHMRRMIEYAEGDGTATDHLGNKVGPGIPVVNPVTGETFVMSPIEAKRRRIEWAKAYIMFCHEMDWISEDEEWSLIRSLPMPPKEAV